MTPTAEELAQAYVVQTRRWLNENVGRIQHCVKQLSDEELWWRPRPGMNSVANLILHLCGNIRQRILATVGGETDDRDRDAEFAERGPIPKTELVGRLEEAARVADDVLANLTANQLAQSRRYQGFTREFHGAVLSTILHCLLHLSGHVQEIVYITRLQLGEAYEFQARPSSPGGNRRD